MPFSFRDISMSEFLNTVNDSAQPVLLCGNGLSINFEPKLGLKNLSEGMYKTHLYIISHGEYTAKIEPVFKSNYSATRKFLIQIIKNEADFRRLFSDAVDFAKSIVESNVVDWLDKNNLNPKLAINISPLDYARDLLKQVDSGNDILCVNYELWSILIYFAMVLLDAPQDIYVVDCGNIFLQSVIKGAKNTIQTLVKKNWGYYFDITCKNGMFIYLRFLLASNILLVGNGYHVEQMSKWDSYQSDNLNQFFQLFVGIMTTNYDRIIEGKTQRPVGHLHGCFKKMGAFERETVLYQSLEVSINAIRYSLSSILIGDYFFAKTSYANSINLSQKFHINTPLASYEDIINQEVLYKRRADTIVIFGLNVENDYHIIRKLQTTLQKNGSEPKKAKIIFCYFTQEDKAAFIRVYKSCIAYSEALNSSIINYIEVKMVDSHNILQRFFIPK